MSTTHTYPWLITIITWCRPFPFVPTNILLIKSKLKLESRAIAVGVAMSPWWQVSLSPPPLAANLHATVFCRNQSVLIELHQSGVIWLIWVTHLYNSYFTRPLLYAVYNTWLTPVTACGSQSTACGIEMRWGQLGLVSTVFLRKIFVLRIDNGFFLIEKYLFQIKWNIMISKYKQYTFYWLMCIWIDWGPQGSSNMNASRDESVETGDESVEAGDESIEAGEKYNNHVMIGVYVQCCG